MTRMDANRRKWLTVNAILLTATALIFPTPASADQTDDAFLAALQKHGIGFTNHNAAIATAHDLCTGLDNGLTPTVLTLFLTKNTNLSVHEAGYFLGDSIASYCPQYRTDSDNLAPTCQILELICLQRCAPHT